MLVLEVNQNTSDPHPTAETIPPLDRTWRHIMIAHACIIETLDATTPARNSLDDDDDDVDDDDNDDVDDDDDNDDEDEDEDDSDIDADISHSRTNRSLFVE